MKSILRKSLSPGSDKYYLFGQGRIKNGRLHVQIPMEEKNRKYGLCLDFLVPDEVKDRLGYVDRTETSLADSTAAYFPLQIRNLTNSNRVKIQIRISNDEHYSFILKVSAHVWEIIFSEIEWAKKRINEKGGN